MKLRDSAVSRKSWDCKPEQARLAAIGQVIERHANKSFADQCLVMFSNPALDVSIPPLQKVDQLFESEIGNISIPRRDFAMLFDQKLNILFQALYELCGGSGNEFRHFLVRESDGTSVMACFSPERGNSFGDMLANKLPKDVEIRTVSEWLIVLKKMLLPDGDEFLNVREPPHRSVADARNNFTKKGYLINTGKAAEVSVTLTLDLALAIEKLFAHPGVYNLPDQTRNLVLAFSATDRPLCEIDATRIGFSLVKKGDSRLPDDLRPLQGVDDLASAENAYRLVVRMGIALAKGDQFPIPEVLKDKAEAHKDRFKSARGRIMSVFNKGALKEADIINEAGIVGNSAFECYIKIVANSDPVVQALAIDRLTTLLSDRQISDSSKKSRIEELTKEL